MGEEEGQIQNQAGIQNTVLSIVEIFSHREIHESTLSHTHTHTRSGPDLQNGGKLFYSAQVFK